MATVHLRVQGMHCEHCSGRVESVLNGVEGAIAATVDLEGCSAKVVGDADPAALVAAVIAAGFEAEVATSGAAGASNHIQLRVLGMHCSHCVAHVTQALLGVPAVETADVDLDTSSASVRGRAMPSDLVAAVTALGFTAEVVSHPAADVAASASTSSLPAAAAPSIAQSAPALPDVTGRGLASPRQNPAAHSRSSPAPNLDADADVEAGLLRSHGSSKDSAPFGEASSSSSSCEVGISGMTCAACVGAVERGLMRHPGVLKASVSLAERERQGALRWE